MEFVDVCGCFFFTGTTPCGPECVWVRAKELSERPGPKTSQHTPERRSVNDFSRQKLPQSNPVFDLLLSDP